MKKATIALLLVCTAAFAQQKGTFTDSRDKKTYKTIKIGEQTWMAENLNYKIPNSICYGEGGYYSGPNSEEGEQDTPYTDKEVQANCAKYGRLYDWQAAMKACPSGWHLPSKSEWEVLTKAVGGEKVAGKKLKAKSGWEKKGNGTDDYGFSALPGGNRFWEGEYHSAGYGGHWWSSSGGEDDPFYLSMSGDNDGVEWQNTMPFYPLSVRCIQDKTEQGGSGYAKGGSGGIGDMLGGLMGGSAGGIGTKSKGSLKAPSARDIDMGSGDASRSKQEIMAVVNARMPGLKNIYDKHLKLKPGFSGKVTLKFTIAPEGGITGINIVSSTTGYAEFDNAVKNFVATWKWKQIKSGDTTPTIPFNFEE